MGLASIPWLTAILSTLASIARWLFGQTKALLFVLGLFLKDLIKWFWGVIQKWGLYKFGLLGALAALCVLAVREALGLIPAIRMVNNGWQALLDMCPGISWLLWDSSGPIRLVDFFTGLKTTFAVYLVIGFAKFIIRTLRWNIQVALGMKLGGGNQ